MPRAKRIQRVGKRLSKVEELWSKLDKVHRTESVLVALCKAAGIPEEDAKNRFRVAIGLLESHPTGAH